MTSVIVKVDHENKAETWWDAFHRAWPKLQEGDPELFSICERLSADQHVEICDPATIQRFVDFAENLPGFADGPEYAKKALIFQQA